MEEQKKDFNYIIRVANTDLDGNKQILNALRKIKGVSFMFANALCEISKVDKKQKIGYLDDAGIKKIEEVLRDPLKFNIPVWMLNRKKDPEEGNDKHLFGSDLKFTQENDIRFMKKIRSYKGVRHSFGLPVRGQRTKSNFRRNKGKVTGVAKSRQAKAAAKPEAKKSEGKKK